MSMWSRWGVKPARMMQAGGNGWHSSAPDGRAAATEGALRLATSAPERTRAAPEAILPERYRAEIDERLVPFGKHVLTGERSMCRQAGVTAHR